MPATRRLAPIDRRFYSRKYDVAKTLEAFLVQPRNKTDLDTLSDVLVWAVSETMQPTSPCCCTAQGLETVRGQNTYSFLTLSLCQCDRHHARWCSQGAFLYSWLWFEGSRAS